MIARSERIEGGLIGMLVGDALGVPYEFHPPHHIPPEALIEFDPPPGFVRAHRGVPPGTWSDDGAHALCLLSSLLDNGRLDLEDFSERLVRWQREGYLAVDGVVFDIGIQTSKALMRVALGALPEEAGPDGEWDNGNGSLMRVLPLALWHQGGDGALVADAARQSRVTHGHIRAQVCCALYCLWARRLLACTDDPFEDAARTLREVYQRTDDGDALQELDEIVLPGILPEGKGYVLDTLHSTKLVMAHGRYPQVVRRAIRLGHDTDTTACVAGGLAGIREGIQGIPARWRYGLRGGVLLAPLIEGLLAHG
ncbi:MAG: ADP-ribosylglycohydrolase family protein [Myxococcota bacterium]